MANTGKYVSTPQSIAEHAALLVALSSIPTSEKSIFFFEAGEVAALLRVDTKTLQRKRKERELALTSGASISDIDIASIAYVPPAPVVRYPASEVEAYLRRLSAASAASARPFGLTRSEGAFYMGFQAWMSTASPTDDWAFSIDGAGRPMDITAAIILGMTTGTAERLTLRQFAERVADCSGAEFQGQERAELAAYLDRPKKKNLDD